MKDQNQKPGTSGSTGNSDKTQSTGAGAGQFGQKNPQSSPTSGSSIGKAPGQSSGKDQGSTSFGQQTHGNYGQTPDARKGSVNDRAAIGSQQDSGAVKSEKHSDTQHKSQDKDLERLPDPDHTKGPARKDVDPVAKKDQGINDPTAKQQQGLNKDQDTPMK